MNVEQSYVKTNKRESIVQIVERRLNTDPEDIELGMELDFLNSYKSILATDKKRKVAISNISNGWLSILESKEVNDYYMLMMISEELHTEVIAIIQSDVTGSWGFIEIANGKIQNTYFSEEDDEIEDLIEKKLDEKGINQRICMFREVVRDKKWAVVTEKTIKNGKINLIFYDFVLEE